MGAGLSASYWWLCKALLRDAKGDQLASHFNRRQPIIREVLNSIEAGWSHRSAKTGESAAREVVWGLFAARSHPQWLSAAAAAAAVAASPAGTTLTTGEEAAANEFLSGLGGNTSVDAVYHAVRSLPYGGVGYARTVIFVEKNARQCQCPSNGKFWTNQTQGKLVDLTRRADSNRTKPLQTQLLGC